MLNYLANPARFMRISGAALPWLGGASLFVLALGLVWSLLLAPPDYQQGESVRIMFIHVPAAWMALSVYLFVAIASAVALVWRHPLAEIAAQAAAPIGAAFTLICVAASCCCSACAPRGTSARLAPCGFMACGQRTAGTASSRSRPAWR